VSTFDTTTPDRQALRWSQVTNFGREKKQKIENSYPSVYLGGHDPHFVGDADKYKFTVKQCYNSYVYGRGYWVFTETSEGPGHLLPPGWTKQPFIDALMTYYKQSQTALGDFNWVWTSVEPQTIVNPNATTPQLILTKNALGQVTAWDPLSGTVTTPGTIDSQWGVEALGDVDAVEAVSIVTGASETNGSNERVRLESGWIRIYDEFTDAPLLQFFVGTDQTQMQLAAP